MRTVSTLCASGLGISLSAVGLTVARNEDEGLPPPTPSPPQSSSNNPRPAEMTSVATFAAPTIASQHKSLQYSSPRPQHPTSTPTRPNEIAENGRKTQSGSARSGTRRKRDLTTPRAHSRLGMDPSPQRDLDSSLPAARTPSSRPQSWLRRLSSSMSSSRDSSRTSNSRPTSAVFHSSTVNYGSTTPLVSNSSPASQRPNKLVKRASSVRGTASSPLTPGSRLPIPNFTRPATSHQRSADMHEQPPSTASSDQTSSTGTSSEVPDRQWRHYFTARAAEASPKSGIPNPIRRVYPDRKYKPVLLSARERVSAGKAEIDGGISEDEEPRSMKFTAGPSVASSPVPVQAAHFGEEHAPKRSFSIGDLLSTGPQPLWKQPSSRKGKTPPNKLTRRRSRVVSAPMGNSKSKDTGLDSDRPAKRRETTNPTESSRPLTSSTSSNRTLEGRKPRETKSNLSSTNNSPRIANESATFEQTPSRTQATSANNSSASRNARHSGNQSDIQSTIGSDSEYRSVGGYSTDYQSDTVYDSIPTRTDRSSSGKRGPPIDTIFDESPITFSSERSTRLRDLLSDGSFPGSDQTAQRHSTIEEEESISTTPVRSLRDHSVTSTPSARPGGLVFASSPPDMALNVMPDPDDIDWDASDDEDADMPNHRMSTPHAQRASLFQDNNLAVRLTPFSKSTNATPHRNGNGSTDRATLFDWAEQQPSPSHDAQSPPRPKTVHGKKDPESRGSRSAGRRAPSGMHARSHSVPVVPDADGKRPNAVANKFGTWGVGSKGVTEDWNEDFDFDELDEPVQLDEKRIDSGHEMFVPKSIREQQENIVANIGLLREWGLLIEELKELRVRAVALDMLRGQYGPAWAEVDAMIELADQESEENTLEPRKSPPSSPGFDFAAFEEALPTIPDRPLSGAFNLPESAFGVPEQTRAAAREPVHQSTPPKTAVTTRPRKDSEAVARSVIEALQTKRTIPDPTVLKAASAPKKVPFDTATLRHIVPYVNGLKRKVKDALRETEGLQTSPRRQTAIHDDEQREDEPAFRSIFNEPQNESSATTRRSRRERAATDHDGYEDAFQDPHGDLRARLQGMTLHQ